MNKIKKMLTSDKKVKFIVAIGIVGVILIYLSSFGATDNEGTTLQEDYAKATEEKISMIVCKITGEKDAAVMVSLESNGKVVYADAKSVSKNNKTDNQSADKYKTEQTDDSKQDYILVKNSQGGEEALVVSKIYPTVKGVVVVTKYADNSAVAERIVAAVATALDISDKRVCVVMGK